MSERQAKKKRQNLVKEVRVNEKSKGNILMNIIIVVIVVAIIGLGVFAIYNKKPANDNQVTVTDTTEDGNVDTLEAFAADIGMTAEDFIKEYGLEGNPEITPETDLYTTFGNMTVENFAKAHSRPVESILAELKNDYPNATKDTIMFDTYATEGATTENE